jgi:hemolysin activation/secretion protein
VPRERLLALVEALQARYREDGYILTVVHGAAEHKDGRLIFVVRATEGISTTSSSTATSAPRAISRCGYCST